MRVNAWSPAISQLLPAWPIPSSTVTVAAAEYSRVAAETRPCEAMAMVGSSGAQVYALQ